ncbi:Oidioi.mRNA.OKI2018_I69.PAR.g10926.t2.cds [Oikopleura dioica]|uniref:Oidioi.mRNA.OKI2018_I69.PAR.g10926.t2.cds n=1 Tax=Oikopleura dioica TaxID=34765 RepID=A0ABN7RT69_OIKDI|nr:Oidioi.mRNA.OKI2018_I69.PAR.g10926.t2.cds [Oikopleura dioica]
MRSNGGGSGDATNMLCRQLFVGQIPGDWTQDTLCKHFCEYLHIPLEEAEDEIHFDREIPEEDYGTKKKIAFIRFAKPMIHKKALDKTTFKGSPVLLNIKESNQEDKKRKLFIGRLSDHVTEDDVEKLISKICPDAAKLIENEFPQVPDKNDGKPKIAFIQFENHNAAYSCKDALKRVFENPQPEVISLLEHMCCRNAKLKDLIDSVDYHKRGRNEIFSLSSSNSVRSLNSYNGGNMEFWYRENEAGATIHYRKDHGIRSVFIPSDHLKKKPHPRIPARGTMVEYREVVPGFSDMSLHSSLSQCAALPAPRPSRSFSRLSHHTTTSMYSSLGGHESPTGPRLRSSLSAQHQSMLSMNQQNPYSAFHNPHSPLNWNGSRLTGTVSESFINRQHNQQNQM